MEFEQRPPWPDTTKWRARIMTVGVPDRTVAALREHCGERVSVLARQPETIEQCERLLDLEAPGIVVLGAFFDQSPSELVRRLKAPPQRAFLPVLVLTLSAEERRDVWRVSGDLALQLPFDDEDLAAAVDGVLARRELVERNLGLDPSTGLLAPHAFIERVDDAIRFVRRYHTSGCVGVLHLERHRPEGRRQRSTLDAVPFTVRWVASVARAALREVDSLGMTDSHGLGVLLLGTSLGGGIVAMRRVLDRVASATTTALDGNKLDLDATAAIASFGNDGVERLFERFDRALHSNRNREPGTLIII